MQDPAIVSRTQFMSPHNANLTHVVPAPGSGQLQPGQRPIYPWSNISPYAGPQPPPQMVSAVPSANPSTNPSPAMRVFPGPLAPNAFVPALPLPAQRRVASTSQMPSASPPPQVSVTVPQPNVNVTQPRPVSAVTIRPVSPARESRESIKTDTTDLPVNRQKSAPAKVAAAPKVRPTLKTAAASAASVTKYKTMNKVVTAPALAGMQRTRPTSADSRNSVKTSATNLTRDGDKPAWNSSLRVDRAPKVELVHGRMEKSPISKTKRSQSPPKRDESPLERKKSLDFHDDAYEHKKEKVKFTPAAHMEKLERPEADAPLEDTPAAAGATSENTAPEISKVEPRDVKPSASVDKNMNEIETEAPSAGEDADEKAQLKAQQVLKEVLDEVEALPAIVHAAPATATPAGQGVMNTYSASPAVGKNLNTMFAQIKGSPLTPIDQLQEWPPEQHDPREDSCARPRPPVHPFNDLAPAPNVQQWVERKKLMQQQQSEFLRTMSDRNFNATRPNISDLSPAPTELIDRTQLAPATTHDTSQIPDDSLDVTQLPAAAKMDEDDRLDCTVPNFTTESASASLPPTTRQFISRADGITHQAVEQGLAESQANSGAPAVFQHRNPNVIVEEYQEHDDQEHKDKRATFRKVGNLVKRVLTSPMKRTREPSPPPEDHVEIDGGDIIPPPPPPPPTDFVPVNRNVVIPPPPPPRKPVQQQQEQQEQERQQAPLILKEVSPDMPRQQVQQQQPIQPLHEAPKGDVQIPVPLPVEEGVPKQEASPPAPVQTECSPKAHELEVQDKGTEEDENLLTVVERHPVLGRLVFTADMDLGPKAGVVLLQVFEKTDLTVVRF